MGHSSPQASNWLAWGVSSWSAMASRHSARVTSVALIQKPRVSSTS